jgi:hypothetical protein
MIVKFNIVFILVSLWNNNHNIIHKEWQKYYYRVKDKLNLTRVY